ncbi:hypothetical protein D3C75_1072090 [compost metagenome]
MCFVQIFLVRGGCGIKNLVGIIQQNPEIADSACTGLGAYRRQSCFHTRETEGALLRFVGLPVEIHFFIRTASHAISPASAGFLVDQNNPVFIPFVHRT